MRNYKFKLSDMIPNAWFYKLRDMGKGRKHSTTKTKTSSKNKKLHPPSTTTTTPTITTNSTNSPKPKQTHQHQQQQQCTTPRKSYYFTRELNQISPNNKINHTSPQEHPRKSSSSSTQRPRRRRRNPRVSSPKLVTSSVSAGCSCRTKINHHHHHHHDYSSSSSSSSSQFGSYGESELFQEAEFRTDHVLPTEASSFDETVIDVDKNSLTRKDDKLEGYEEYDYSFSELDLPPIITKSSKPKPKTRISTTTTTKIHQQKDPNSKGSLKVRILKEDTKELSIEKKASVKGFSVSPRLVVGGKKASNGRKSVSGCSGYRRSISESFAVVKSSLNPQKDFRESMVEMIVENNIRASKDLEDLLACYLTLNSDEYHELIINVFKQIWFDLTEKRQN